MIYFLKFLLHEIPTGDILNDFQQVVFHTQNIILVFHNIRKFKQALQQFILFYFVIGSLLLPSGIVTGVQTNTGHDNTEHALKTNLAYFFNISVDRKK